MEELKNPKAEVIDLGEVRKQKAATDCAPFENAEWKGISEDIDALVARINKLKSSDSEEDVINRLRSCGEEQQRINYLKQQIDLFDNEEEGHKLLADFNSEEEEDDNDV